MTQALYCIVPAAGYGQRFGGDLPKQYVQFAGKFLLLHTLERLATHIRIDGLMVVLSSQDVHWPGLDELHGKPIMTTLGGAERADSVLAGLHALPETIGMDNYVLIHDAVRPCVTHEDISRLIDLAGPAGGGLLASPVIDTLKRADNNLRVTSTKPRNEYWHALTPQMFRRGELVHALTEACKAGVRVTDESMAMERMGAKPLLVEGAQNNIKVTTPTDSALLEFLLARQQ